MILRALRGLCQWSTIFYLHSKSFQIRVTLMNMMLREKSISKCVLFLLPSDKIKKKWTRESHAFIFEVWKMGMGMWFADMVVSFLVPVLENERPFTLFSVEVYCISAQWAAAFCHAGVPRWSGHGLFPSLSRIKKTTQQSKVGLVLCLLPHVLSRLLICFSSLACLHDRDCHNSLLSISF